MARAISTNGAGITQVQFRVSGPSTLVANGTLVSDVPTNGGWQYDWASAPGGSYTLRAMATDAGGRIAFSTNVSFTLNNPPVAVDDAIEFTMNSTNDVNVLANDSDPNGHAFTVTQLLDAPTRGFTNLVDGVVYYAPSNNVFGRDSFRYVIADIHGAKATGTVSVLIRPGGSNYVVNYTNSTQIAQPSNHVEIIGATNVIGTAHSDFLDYWKLEYRRRGGARSVWTQIATGTTNVWSGLLGVFDPTGLPNGQYDLRVTLHDLFGSWQDSETTVLVTENNKIGHFTLSFTDLQIPVSGLPITLTRTYDSRMMEVGDFGVGWNLDVSSVRLEKSGLMGKGWGASAGTDSIGRAFAGVQETETHTVSIVFPDGKVYRFRPEVWLGKEQNWTGATHLSAGEANVIYTNLPGTVGTLRELNPPSYLALGYVAMNEPVTLHDVRPNPYETGDTNDFGPFYDPQEFEFTTLDGRKFQFNAAGKVIRMMDRVGNALEFRADGIIHTNSGKSVKFIRDAAGRIEEIYDPNGLNTAGQPSGPPAMQYKYDGAGNLENALRLNTRNATNPAYLTTTMGYTNAKYPHYLTDITDPRGIKAIRNEYGDDGRLKSMTDASGKTINYIHSVSNRTEIIVDRLSRTNTFVYDTKGNVTESVNPLGHTNRFTYDANGNQLTHTDPLGHITTNTFDANDNLLSVTLPHKPGENPAAFTTRFTYDASGELTSTILPTGGVLTSVVDPDSGNLLQALAGTNLITSFVYDANGNVTAEGDRFGTNGFAYDAYGNALRMTNTLGQVIESGYDPNGNLTNLIDNGVTSSFQLDALGREAFSDYGNGITLSNSFDSHLDWTSVDAPTIGHMERRFDEQGRLAGWKTVNGATPGFAYNDNGQLEYETNSVGVVTYYTYDAAGRIAATTNLATAAGNAFAFDAAGRKVFEVNALGHATGYAFNPDGSLAAMTNAFGTNVWTYSYETGGGCCGGNGASASVTDPLGRVSKTVRSPYGLPLEAIFTSGSLSATSKTAYISGMVSPDQEAEEYPATITDEGGRTRTNSYTSLGQLETATDLGGNRWTNKYDSTSGAVTQIVNPLGSNHLKYIYDTLDNVRTLIFADGGALTNFYDSANRLNGSRLPSGTLVTNFFDSAGRLTNRQAKVNGMLTESVAFGYNSGDAVTIMIDNTGGTTNLYDSAGRFMGSDYPTGASVRYARDLLDRIIAITNKASGGGSNYVTQYRYDAVGNVTNVIDHWGGNTYLEYDQVNRRTKRTLPNGVVSEWQYDWRDRVTNITHKISSTTLASVGYMRASGGEPTRITREDGSYVLLAYDSALRLTNEIFHSSGGAPQSTNGYGYDAAGTRIRLVKAGLAYTNAVTQGYRVTQVKTNGIVAESYDYDLSGRVTNVVRDGVTQRLGYNSADQLVAVTNGSAWTQYVHDGGGRRSKATDQAGAERRFLVAPTAGADLESPHLIADSGNTLKQVYLHLEDQPLMRFDGSGGNSRTYYLEDGMGSVIGIVPHTSPGTGNTSRLFYDGFGNSRTTNGPAPTIPAGTGGDFRFHGLWQETNSGLYHVRARDYDPRTGRFLSRDPVEGDARVPESLYPYSYASSNPHLYSDPSGQFSVIEISITGAKQITFQTFRQLAVAKAKAWAKDKISDFLLDQLVSTLSGLLPIDINALFAEGRSRAGFKFEDMVLGPICDVLGEAGDIFWLGPKVSKGGTVYDNGVNCDGFEERPVGPTGVRGLARPDFIISTKPPVERGKYHNQSLVIGDVKLSGALHSYLNGRQRTQFDAIVSYSSKYTLSRSALFITVWSGKSKHHKAISKQLEQHARGKGVLFVVLSLDDVTPSKRKR
jgi:RHS repeat-associated protein